MRRELALRRSRGGRMSSSLLDCCTPSAPSSILLTLRLSIERQLPRRTAAFLRLAFGLTRGGMASSSRSPLLETRRGMLSRLVPFSGRGEGTAGWYGLKCEASTLGSVALDIAAVLPHVVSLEDICLASHEALPSGTGLSFRTALGDLDNCCGVAGGAGERSGSQVCCWLSLF